MVSRIGLGTLHLGDKIGGLSDAKAINEWINAGVASGITLFDTADVSQSLEWVDIIYRLIALIYKLFVGLSSEGRDCGRFSKTVGSSVAIDSWTSREDQDRSEDGNLVSKFESDVFCD